MADVGIPVTCPRCGAEYAVPGEFAGLPIPCRGCGSTFVHRATPKPGPIPAVDEGPGPDSEAEQALEAGADGEDLPPPED
jgi:hypothetical protein